VNYAALTMMQRARLAQEVGTMTIRRWIRLEAMGRVAEVEVEQSAALVRMERDETLKMVDGALARLEGV
jgi:hypothetical protein